MANTALPWIGFITLLDALAKRAGAGPTVDRIRAKPWSSMDLSGARFCFSLWFEGVDGRVYTTALTYKLEDAEFDLEDYFVVDIVAGSQIVNATGATVEIEALLLPKD